MTSVVRQGDEMAISQQVMAVSPVMDSEQYRRQYGRIREFYDLVMQEDVDFGKIPGAGDKPTLLKPGAQKLGSLFGLAPSFSIVKEIADWTGKDYNGEPFLYYRVRCDLYQGLRLVGSGLGTASSWEDRYRYRWVAEGDIPSDADRSKLVKREAEFSEYEFGIKKRETTGKYGKSVKYWDMFAEAMANGDYTTSSVEFNNGRTGTLITVKRASYRIPNLEVGSLDNTLLKQANKRAYVDAILYVTGASSFFTQDVEDIPDLGYTEGDRVTSSIVDGSDKVADTAREAKSQKLWTDDEVAVRQWAAKISHDLGMGKGELGQLFKGENTKATDFSSQEAAERWVRSAFNRLAGDAGELTNETENGSSPRHWTDDPALYEAWRLETLEKFSLSSTDLSKIMVDNDGMPLAFTAFASPEDATAFVSTAISYAVAEDFEDEEPPF